MPDPVTAPFILEAFKLYDEGATMRKIRDTLNNHGVKNTRGQPLIYNSVQHLLNNRRYMGEYAYRDIVVLDGIPALVPQDLFDRVQKMAKNKKAPSRHKAVKEELETKIACEKLEKPKISAEFMTFWLHRFRKLDVTQKSHRKMLIDTFINAIYLYDDKMLLTFNFKDSTKTITFGAVKEATTSAASGSDLDCSTALKENLESIRIVENPLYFQGFLLLYE